MHIRSHSDLADLLRQHSYLLIFAGSHLPLLGPVNFGRSALAQATPSLRAVCVDDRNWTSAVFITARLTQGGSGKFVESQGAPAVGGNPVGDAGLLV